MHGTSFSYIVGICIGLFEVRLNDLQYLIVIFGDAFIVYLLDMLKFYCRENIKTIINCLCFFILCTYLMFVGLVIILVVFVCDCFTLHVRHACMEPHLVGNLASIGMHRWVVIMNSRLGSGYFVGIFAS